MTARFSGPGGVLGPEDGGADGSPPTAYGLLSLLLPEQPRSASLLQRWWPTSGTLHDATDPWLEGRSHLAELFSGLRSVGQVILINNPLSGALLLLALALQSGWMLAFAILGIAGAQAMAIAMAWDATSRRQGILGFNGALVGCAAATVADPVGPALALWLVAVPLAGAASAALLEVLRRRFFALTGLPPLSVPACLIGWLLPVFGAGLQTAGLASAPVASPLSAAVVSAAHGLVEGIVRGFAQVFLCAGLPSGLLVLAAVALASPVAALLGALGALAAALSALLLGLHGIEEVATGASTFNGVLVAIAIGGIFFAPNRRSVPIALAGAALTAPLAMLLEVPLTRVGLTLASLPFVLATWLVLLLVRRSLPALVPVALHAVLTPEEHRQRFRVARRLLSDFRARLQHADQGLLSASAGLSLAATTPLDQLERLRILFRRLDQDVSGCLSLAELRQGLLPLGAAADHLDAPALLRRVVQSMDLNGDGRLDEDEFIELVLRLQRLAQGHERLLAYLLPVDADADDRLDRVELARLLRSVGARPLQGHEERRLFGLEQRSLSWGEFVDRLLLG